MYNTKEKVVTILNQKGYEISEEKSLITFDEIKSLLLDYDFEDFPAEGFLYLKNVEELTINNLHESEIPAQVKSLKNLKSLTIFNTKIIKIDNSFCSFFQQLEHLSVYGNKSLIKIPDFFFKNNQITEFTFIENKLRHIDSFSFFMPKIEKLDLSGNFFGVNFFRFFFKFKNLNILFLDNCKFPKTEFLLPKSIYYVSICECRELFPDIVVAKNSDIREVIIHTNRLEEIPSFLKELRNIHSIDISNNNIKKIPDWLSKLEYLDSIDISNNKIEILPEWFVKKDSNSTFEKGDHKS